MPRIADVYSPPYDPVVSGTPIESVEYNGTVADITIDLNAPRPIVAGGTGADSAEEARFNLAAETAAQVVTNYDSHMWLPGSFRSATTATGTPVDGHEFAGVCYLNEALAFPPANQNVVVEARDQDDTTVPGRMYVREKKAGVWGAWAFAVPPVEDIPFPPSGSISGDSVLEAIQELDTEKVAKAGDIMTGLLTLSGAPVDPLHASTKQYVDDQGTSATGKFVRFDTAQGLTPAQQAQARANIDVPIVKKNYIINGAMMISQENGGNGGSLAASFIFYPADMFLSLASGTTGTATAQNFVQRTPGGSTSRIRYVVITADAAVAATDFAFIDHYIEGTRAADLMFGTASAKTVTLQFGVKAPAGTYCCVLMNAATNRSYVAEYVIAAGEANTDVRKSVTIPGDTTGTWVVDTGRGLIVRWGLMAGTTNQQAAGSWGTVYVTGSPNQFNFFGTMGNTFELFDVSLTEGTVAPPFVVPDYASELALCHRYYEKITGTIGVGHGVSATLALISVFFAEKRAPPTLGALNLISLNLSSPVGNPLTATNVSAGFSYPTTRSGQATISVASGLVAGNATIFWGAGSGAITLSARL